MKALKYILITILIVVVGVVVAAMVTQKSEYDLSQSLTIPVSPETASDYVSDLKTWSVWGPWNKNDTTIVTTYGEIYKGKGANMSWTSKDGPGALTITEYSPGQSILTKMDFGGAPADGYWSFEADGEGTKVTWGMKGKKDLMFKIFSMFMNFDKYMQEMHMQGLEGIEENIGEYASANATPTFKLSEIDTFDGEAKYLIGFSHKGEINMEAIQGQFQTDMPKAGMFAAQEKIENYMPGAVWMVWDEENNNAEYAIGIIVSEANNLGDGMTNTEIPAGKVLKITKWGPYGTGDKEAHEAINQYMTDNGLSHVLTWEEYPNDPMEVKPEEVQTDILYLVK